LPSVPSPFKVIRGSTNSESGYLGLVVHPSYGEEKELTKKKKKKNNKKKKQKKKEKKKKKKKEAYMTNALEHVRNSFNNNSPDGSFRLLRYLA
jgi:hypothetical protein